MIKLLKNNNILHNKNIIFSIICIIAICILLLIPTGFEKQIYTNAEGVKAQVLSTDESAIYDTGLIKQGDQICEVEILSGDFKGKKVRAVNLLTGSLETDKIFNAGDKAFILLEKSKDGNIVFANMVDHYRLNLEVILISLFVIVLVIFSGSTGIRTVISFAFTLICILKLFVPMLLKGYHPILLALVIGILISTVTLILVGGFTKKAYCAILGSVFASLVTCILAIIFGNIFKIHGTVMQWSESLLYSGFQDLNLTLIYQSGIYLSCSGAILDLAIDISASIDELVDKNPKLSKKEILLSGITIGKSIVGSQTTTLLLAYMGSFIGVMMVYMAQGTPLLSILNTRFISSEILQTFVGCIGLVIVSPLTATICSYVYTKKAKN
ncbi:YibE/F family protein [Clostridium sp. CCUG 7971]|uniref:YibE/F family protein n=1 Tax=Clostridium sp. CCUG 7971 TaxID=2811414 RepID=UPI001ABA59E0|nr:YibE/F family protein [Clostridium sp. CCUG 7971]MBO3444150.1 YibE/F family protein [Clostridium sp. CCUG 7971]